MYLSWRFRLFCLLCWHSASAHPEVRGFVGLEPCFVMVTLMCRPSHQAQLPACQGNGFLERCPGYIPSFGERFRTKRTHRLSRPSASCHVRSCVAKLQLLPNTPTIVVFIPELCSTHFRCRCPISCRQGCVTCCFHSIDAQLQFVGPSA